MLSSQTRAWMRIVPLAAAVAFSAACVDFADFAGGERYKEDFHKTVPLRPGGTLTVENFNGSIEIFGWDQESLEVDGTKYAGSRQVLDALQIDVSGSADAAHIRSIRPDFSHGSMGVRYTIHVPRKVNLDRVSSTNGSIRIEDLQGNAQLHSSNGRVRVARLNGGLTAETTNGGIEIRELSGRASLRTSNGGIDAEAGHGSFEAETTNGKIAARLTDTPADARVRLESNNGHIDLRLDAKPLPEVRASTTNAGISVTLPASAEARVRASTSHGGITSEFDALHSDGGRHRGQLDGTLGSGGPLIELTTTNGGVKILKR